MGSKFIFSKNSPRDPLKSLQSFFPNPMYPNQNVRNFPDVIYLLFASYIYGKTYFEIIKKTISSH